MDKCCVDGCGRRADLEVVLYDFYLDSGSVFFERDATCPMICKRHAIENESGVVGVRRPRGLSRYPHSNKDEAQGFTIYRPLPT